MVFGDDLFRRLCRARAVLEEDDDAGERSASIAEVARGVRMSRFHFIRRFDALFGATPHAYRTRMRLERAKDLLIAGDRSVTEVCMELGFSSLGTFSSRFTRATGVSPSAFRRRALVQVPVQLSAVVIPGCFGLMGSLPIRNFGEASGRRSGRQ
jgi:AraC-like DNA-binding protein